MRASALMCVEVMAMVVISVGIEKRSCEEDMGLEILLLTCSPLALRVSWQREHTKKLSGTAMAAMYMWVMLQPKQHAINE